MTIHSAEVNAIKAALKGPMTSAELIAALKVLSKEQGALLKEARAAIEQARQALAERDGDATGSAAVEERSGPAGGTLRLEYVKCGKGDRCRCADGLGHGPYWYEYVRRGGRLVSRYIGKQLPAQVTTPGDESKSEHTEALP